MTDLEGVAGVGDVTNWCVAAGRYYTRARELLTKEVNAAIEGFLQAGVREILVADGHGEGAIDPEGLNPAAELVRNWPSSKSGSFSLDEGKYDIAAWVGQHPMAGTIGGHLCHTGDMSVVEQRINGILVGEFGSLVLIATELGVRSVFATGCEAFCREAEALVPGIETVAVKKGTQTDPGNHLPADLYRKHNTGAVHIHPEESRRRVKAGATQAAERAAKEDFGFVKLPEPPYRRRIIIRGDSNHPPRLCEQIHPSSIMEMHRAPFVVSDLLINPADPVSRNREGDD